MATSLISALSRPRFTRTLTAPRFFIAVFLLLVLGALGAPLPASASPGANDNFADAQPVSSLPFTDSGDLSGTTLEPGEPQACFGFSQSAWYVFTPSSNVSVSVDASGSDPQVSFVVWQSFGGINNLGFIGCASSQQQQPVKFGAQAGSSYYIQAVGNGSPDQLHMHVAQVPAPPNDNFAQAVTVPGLPFSDPVDMTTATTEPGEPTFPNGAFTSIDGSVWYAFTPSQSETVSASVVDSLQQQPLLAAYRGSSLANLTQVAGLPGYGYSTLSFRATAGTTYYLQMGRSFSNGNPVSMTFRLDLAPPPTAQFFTNTFDPSSFDTIGFYDYSYDPAGLGITSWSWDFGDGKTSTDQSPQHHYAADGDYTVKETVTTTDGRSSSTTQVIHVRTHDVAVNKLVAPDSGRVGKTVQLVAKLSNIRYQEAVEVDFLKSVPGGFVQFGSSFQTVPVMKKTDTFNVKINYTFTSDDASIGKVSFKAVVRLLGGRDALPGDNEVISSPPTKVKS